MSLSQDYDTLHRALTVLRDRLPRLAESLSVESAVDLPAWQTTLDTRVLPRLSPDFPLMAAICGGGSSGKSTLFNSLVGARLSPTGGKAGLNRRVLVAIPPALLEREEFLSDLFQPFATQPDPLDDMMRLTRPGPPLYVAAAALPPSLLLADTPDFDVGRGGEYLNRGQAEPVLRAADLLIYIFTNATYNAKANVDFIREHLTRIGHRRSILVYRIYQSFPDSEVMDHASTVAENLYGPDWKPFVLAIYRTDDSNDVASGQSLMTLRPVTGQRDMLDLLGGLDPREFRREQNAALIRDIVLQARRLGDEALAAREELIIYRDVSKVALGHAVTRALRSLPLAHLIQRIREIFERTDPAFLKFTRQAGRITGAPLRGLLKLLGRSSDGGAEPQGPEPREVVKADLLEAANQLRRALLSEELATQTTQTDPDGAMILSRIASLRQMRGLGGSDRPLVEATGEPHVVSLYVRAHPALAEVRRAMYQRPWREGLRPIEDLAEEVLTIPEELDRELTEIIREFRKDLPLLKKFRAGLMATLNLIPPLVAVGYVFATADPVVGTTIAGKLSSLFGLHDLWATVTIPASMGLDEASRKDLERLLSPILTKWLDNRRLLVQGLLTEAVMGDFLEGAHRLLEGTGSMLNDVRSSLEQAGGEKR